jgi:hypothetical protein
LHIDFTKRLIGAVAIILACHAKEKAGVDAGAPGSTKHHEGHDSTCCN